MGSSPSHQKSLTHQLSPQQDMKETYENFQSFEKQNIKIVERYILTHYDIEMICNILQKQFFAHEFSQQNLYKLAKQFQKAVCQVNDSWLFKQGSSAHYLFIINKGSVDVVKEGYFVRSLRKGDFFGELALLYGIRRSSSIKIPKECAAKNEFFVLHKNIFLDFMHKAKKQDAQEILQILGKCFPLKYIAYYKQKELAKSAFNITLNANRRIFTRFDEPYALFFILQGSVRINFPNRSPVFISSNEYFGYHGSARSDFSAIVAQDCTCIAIGKESLERVLKQDMIFLFLENRLRHILMWNQFLKKISYQRINKVIVKFKFRKANVMTPICRVNQLIQKLYVPIDCLLAENPNQIFGIAEYYHQSRYYATDLAAEKQGYYAEIDLEDFQRILELSQHGKELNKIGNCMKPFDIRLCEEIKVLKYNSVGEAFQILYKEPKFEQEFIFRKYSYEIDESEQIFDKTITIMKEINSDFIQNFYNYHKNFQFGTIYLEHIHGLNLQTAVQQLGAFSIPNSRFYISIILLITQQMHRIQVINRNWQLSDYLVDPQGYLWLINFDNSKVFDTNIEQNSKQMVYYQPRKQRTNTILEVPYICAPQMILKKGYKREIDFWGIGLLLYQLVFGCYPFGADKEDPILIYESILSDPLLFPIHLRNKQVKQLLNKLLSRESQARENLNFEEIKQMGFFRGMDWESLSKKQVHGYYIPKMPQQEGKKNH